MVSGDLAERDPHLLPKRNCGHRPIPRLCHAPSLARVAELADAPDLGSGAERREGSSPFSCTTS